MNLRTARRVNAGNIPRELESTAAMYEMFEVPEARHDSFATDRTPSHLTVVRHSIAPRSGQPMIGRLVVVFLTAGVCTYISAHPAGSLVTTGEVVTFSYVCPVGDVMHRGCVMIWDRQNGVREWIRSDRSPSDYHLSTTDEPGELLILESYYESSRDVHRYRVLEGRPGSPVREITGWRDSPRGLGDGGFAAAKDGFLAVEYPAVMHYQFGGERTVWLDLDVPIRRIRRLHDGSYLLLLEPGALHVDQKGRMLARWGPLVTDLALAPTVGGNIVFDADLDQTGGLVLAYWGNRSVDAIRPEGRTTMLQFQIPWIPHAVATHARDVFVIASTLEPGRAIEPQLWLVRGKTAELLWQSSGQ